MGSLIELFLETVSLSPCRFKVKNKVLHIQPQLCQRFLNHREDAATTDTAFNHLLHGWCDEIEIVRRELL